MLTLLKLQATLFGGFSLFAVLTRLLPQSRVRDFLVVETLRLQLVAAAASGILLPLFYLFGSSAESLAARVVPLFAGLSFVPLSLFLTGAMRNAPLPWHEVVGLVVASALLPVRFSARPFADLLMRAALLLVLYTPARTFVFLRYPESRPRKVLREIEALMRLSTHDVKLILFVIPFVAWAVYSHAPKALANQAFVIMALALLVEIVAIKALFRYGRGHVARWSDRMNPCFEQYVLDSLLAVALFVNQTFRIGTGFAVDLLNTKANIFGRSGGFRQALDLAERSYALWIGAGRPVKLWALQAVTGLAGFLASADNRDRAELVLRDGIAAFQARPDVRAVSEYGEMLSMLGKVALRQGRIEEAESLCREGLEVLRTHLGHERMETLSAFASLQVCLAEKGEIREPDEEQLEYLGAAFENPMALRRFTGLALWYYHSLGLSYLRKGEYAEARRAFLRERLTERRIIGRRTADQASTYLQLAITAAALRRPRKALFWIRLLIAAEEHGTTAVFSISDESHRLSFVRRFVLPVSVSVTLALLYEDELGEAGRTAACLYAIRRKGLVAESMLWQEHLRSDRVTPEIRTALQEWHQLQKAMASGQETPDKAVRRERELATWIEDQFPELRLEERLRRIDWNSFQAALSSDVTLVEFVRVRSVAFNPVMNGGETFGPARYVAFFVTKGNAPRLVDIGTALEVDLAIAQRIINVREPDLYPSAQAEVWRLLGEPIASLCPTGSRLIIAPDGELNRFPFEILRDAASEASPYFLTRYRISYANCGRDLLRHAGRRDRTNEWRSPLFVAVEQFRLSSDSPSLEPPSEPSSEPLPAQFRASGIKFEDLTGTLAEVHLIRARWGGKVLLNQSATRERLFEELGPAATPPGGPCILHFATHGWVMGASNSEAGGLSALRRVGLALAGAQTYLERDDEASQTLPAGQFTGIDVLACDLRNTELVVLSCCSTGLGDLSYSEGVLGLQRAFLLSGAATIVMSLWNVDDTATCRLMQIFYARLRAGESRAAALNRAKAALLGGLFSDPKYWAGFVLQGDDSPLPRQMLRTFPQVDDAVSGIGRCV